jgi:hypothetical protein
MLRPASGPITSSDHDHNNRPRVRNSGALATAHCSSSTQVAHPPAPGRENRAAAEAGCAPARIAHPHCATHSYPRHDGATRHAHRCMTHRHTPRPHDRTPLPRHTQLPAPRRRHRPRASVHDASPHAATARFAPASHAHTRRTHSRSHHRGRLGLLCTGKCAPTLAVHSSGVSWTEVAAATSVHEELVARGFATRSVRKSAGTRRAAAEHVTANHGHRAVRARTWLRHSRPREAAIRRTRCYLSPTPRCPMPCGRAWWGRKRGTAGPYRCGYTVTSA